MSRVTNFKKDLILGEGTPFQRPVVEAAYAGKLPVDDPPSLPRERRSPGASSMLIQAGSYEVFSLKSRSYEESGGSGRPDDPHRVPRMSDFALCLPELQESIDSLKEIRDFVNRIDRAK